MRLCIEIYVFQSEQSIVLELKKTFLLHHFTICKHFLATPFNSKLLAIIFAPLANAPDTDRIYSKMVDTKNKQK